MMTGTGPFGPIEMGGMFTVMKVRKDLAPGDYRDPGWYKHPLGSVAYEVNVARRASGAEIRRRRNPGERNGDAGNEHAWHEARCNSPARAARLMPNRQGKRSRMRRHVFIAKLVFWTVGLTAFASAVS